METKAAYSQPLYLHLSPPSHSVSLARALPSHPTISYISVISSFVSSAKNSENRFPGLHCSVTSILDLSIFGVEEANVKCERYPIVCMIFDIVDWRSGKKMR